MGEEKPEEHLQIEDHLLLKTGGNIELELDTEGTNMGGERPVHEPGMIIMHYTAGTFGGTVATFSNPSSFASSHIIIGRRGQVLQMVPFDRRAWHAGQSSWMALNGLNKRSIGIELENPGALTSTSDGKWKAWYGAEYRGEEMVIATHKYGSRAMGWLTYPEEQLRSAIAVCRAIKEQYHIVDILGHDDVSPGRKIDPGPAFPMDSFRAAVQGRSYGDTMMCELTADIDFRKGPSVDGNVIATLDSGHVVEHLGEWHRQWHKVRYLDLEGWCHGSFLDPLWYR